MSEQIAFALNSLSETARQEAYDFIMFLFARESRSSEKKIESAEEVLSAFNEAKVCVPITWTREEISERA